MTLFPTPDPEGDPPPQDNKYVVFKRSDWERRCQVSGLSLLPEMVVKDAVVIRRQDIAAPPILDAYANFYLSIRELLLSSPVTDETEEHIAKCQELAEYFHEQATASWSADRKFPT